MAARLKMETYIIACNALSVVIAGAARDAWAVTRAAALSEGGMWLFAALYLGTTAALITALMWRLEGGRGARRAVFTLLVIQDDGPVWQTVVVFAVEKVIWRAIVEFAGPDGWGRADSESSGPS